MTAENQEERFCLKGLTAAVFTPFHENGDVNLDIISGYIDYMVKDGVKNAFICGTNGEGWSMTVAERKLVAEHWKKVNNGRFSSLVVNVGSSSLRDSQELAAHAESIGIDAIASTPPVGYKTRNLDILVRTMKQIAEKAPSTPFYYYHFSVTNEPTVGDMEDFFDAIQWNPIPTFCGIKFTSFQIYELKRCLLKPERYQICSGHDEGVLPVLSVGCKDFVGGTINFQSKLFTKIIEAYERKDLESAGRYYDQLVVNCNALRKHSSLGGVSICKTVMKLLGMDLGHCRLPLHNLSPEEADNLRKDLKQAGFFESIE